MTDRLAELISRKLSGEASPEELLELEEYLQNKPGDQYFTELLASYWNALYETAKEPVTENDTHFEQILRLAEDNVLQNDGTDGQNSYLLNTRRKKIITKWLAAAAVIFIIAFSAVFYFKLKPAVPITEKGMGKNEVIAQRGAKSHLLLPDGSKVWLNSDSKLSYSNFNDTLREVELEGEAFFDVVKQPSRPFIVHTSGIAIHVLGTAFNVKSYPEEPIIETTLIRGLIQVEKNNQPDAAKIILHPHEKLVFNKKEETIVKATDVLDKNEIEKKQQLKDIAITSLPVNIADSSLKETSWVYNRLQFDGDSFEELSNKMERWFNVKIILKNDKLADQRLHGSFENETIEQAMQALQLMTSFEYKINGNEIEIDKK